MTQNEPGDTCTCSGLYFTRHPNFREPDAFIMRSVSAPCSKEKHDLCLWRLFSTQTSLRRYPQTQAGGNRTGVTGQPYEELPPHRKFHAFYWKNLRNHVNHVQYFFTRKHLSWFYNVSQNCKTFSFWKGKNTTMTLQQYPKLFCFSSFLGKRLKNMK